MGEVGTVGIAGAERGKWNQHEGSEEAMGEGSWCPPASSGCTLLDDSALFHPLGLYSLPKYYALWF